MPQSEGKKHPSHLVLGFLEGISSRVFSEYSQQITELVGQKQGVYALYKGNRLYYVGLATNLRTRVKEHLRDKHKGKWNKFSVYLVRKSEHIKELESLILRIADPKGNAVRGRLPGADNLRPKIRAKMKAAAEKQISSLLGRQHSQKAVKKKPTPKKAAPRESSGSWKKAPPLAALSAGRMRLRAERKGQTYEATLERNGKIEFGGEVFHTPSGAAKAAIGHAQNGWYFWRYRDPSGEWVYLQQLRAEQSS